jgi:hypothetical protein
MRVISLKLMTLGSREETRRSRQILVWDQQLGMIPDYLSLESIQKRGFAADRTCGSGFSLA